LPAPEAPTRLPARNRTIGIDFGTTNSALAWTNEAGEVEVASFHMGDEPLTTFRSILYCEADAEPHRKPLHWCGPGAIAQYFVSDEEGRLMQSMKTFLASKHVKSTSVFGHDQSLEMLISLIISGLSWSVGLGERDKAAKIIAGRPVRFANADSTEDDDYAESRLRTAFKMTGFEEVEFVADFESWIEPELASFDTTVDELLTEANLDVADVDAVFLTGGTAQILAVRALFAARFGESKLRVGSYLTSIAEGLAHPWRRRCVGDRGPRTNARRDGSCVIHKEVGFLVRRHRG